MNLKVSSCLFLTVLYWEGHYISLYPSGTTHALLFYENNTFLCVKLQWQSRGNPATFRGHVAIIRCGRVQYLSWSGLLRSETTIRMLGRHCQTEIRHRFRYHWEIDTVKNHQQPFWFKTSITRPLMSKKPSRMVSAGLAPRPLHGWIDVCLRSGNHQLRLWREPLITPQARCPTCSTSRKWFHFVLGNNTSGHTTFLIYIYDMMIGVRFRNICLQLVVAPYHQHYREGLSRTSFGMPIPHVWTWLHFFLQTCIPFRIPGICSKWHHNVVETIMHSLCSPAGCYGEMEEIGPENGIDQVGEYMAERLHARCNVRGGVTPYWKQHGGRYGTQMATTIIFYVFLCFCSLIIILLCLLRRHYYTVIVHRFVIAFRSTHIVKWLLCF